MHRLTLYNMLNIRDRYRNKFSKIIKSMFLIFKKPSQRDKCNSSNLIYSDM